MSRLAVPSTGATRARQDESRLRELDRKSSGAAAGVDSLLGVARHHWHGSGLVDAGGVSTGLTAWINDVDDGIAKLSAGQLKLNREGRWSLWFQYTSDCTEAGNSACWLDGASAALSPWGPNLRQLRDERLRGSGYTQAGNLTQAVVWSGVVLGEQAASPINPRVMWRSASGTAQATGGWTLTAHYLGAARLPE
jgi:hypothetical protein